MDVIHLKGVVFKKGSNPKMVDDISLESSSILTVSVLSTATNIQRCKGRKLPASVVVLSEGTSTNDDKWTKHIGQLQSKKSAVYVVPV